MLFIIVSSPAKIYDLDGVIEGPQPDSLFESILSSSPLCSCCGDILTKAALVFGSIFYNTASAPIFLNNLISLIIVEVFLRIVFTVRLRIRKLFAFIDVSLSLDLDRPTRLVSHLLLCVQLQENILWLEISMSKTHFLVHKLNPLQGLPCDILNLMKSEPVIFVALDEFVKTLPQGLKNEASLDCLLIFDSLFMDEGFFEMNDVVFASASVPKIL